MATDQRYRAQPISRRRRPQIRVYRPDCARGERAALEALHERGGDGAGTQRDKAHDVERATCTLDTRAPGKRGARLLRVGARTERALLRRGVPRVGVGAVAWRCGGVAAHAWAMAMCARAMRGRGMAPRRRAARSHKRSWVTQAGARLGLGGGNDGRASAWVAERVCGGGGKYAETPRGGARGSGDGAHDVGGSSLSAARMVVGATAPLGVGGSIGCGERGWSVWLHAANARRAVVSSVTRAGGGSGRPRAVTMRCGAWGHARGARHVHATAAWAARRTVAGLA